MTRLLFAFRLVTLWGVLLLGSGCASSIVSITPSQLEPAVSFHTDNAGEKLPVEAAIYLPDDVLQQLPALQGAGPEVWSWFFTEGIASVFADVQVVTNLEAYAPASEYVIIQPELWGYFLQSYRGTWTCWLDARFRFIDETGRETRSIFAEGRAQRKLRTHALAAAMNQVVARFQEHVAIEKDRILAASKPD